MKKKDIYDNRFKIVTLNIYVRILHTRTWSKNGDHIELNFEGLEMQKCGHLTSYHVHSQSDGH